jgi:hypothetical protein
MNAQQHDPNGGRVLDNLFTATQPVLAAILATAGFTATEVTRVELQIGSPIVVRVTVTDAGGKDQVFLGEPFGDVGAELAKALGEFVTSGLNRLPEGTGPAVDAALTAGASIVVTIDPVFGSASAAVYHDNHDPIQMFTLMQGDVH